MIFGRTYETFTDAYLECLRITRQEPNFLNSARGYPNREIIGMAYRISSPRERQIMLKSRRSNIVFNFAEVLWYLSGRDDVDFIGFYAPRFNSFADSVGKLHGSAYGPRIFHRHSAGICSSSAINDQWSNALRELSMDPDSRRAVIQIFSPEEISVRENPDVACTIALQYLIREGSLHAVTYMRSNDAYRGAASDVFSFTFLQEIMANQLKLELGSYSHVVGSFHLYESDDERVREMLANQTDLISSAPFPSMPAGDNWPSIQIVLDLEERIRQGSLSLREPDFEKLGLDYYWQQIVRMLTIYCERRHTGNIDWQAVEFLHPLYAATFYNLWGST